MEPAGDRHFRHLDRHAQLSHARIELDGPDHVLDDPLVGAVHDSHELVPARGKGWWFHRFDWRNRLRRGVRWGGDPQTQDPGHSDEPRAHLPVHPRHYIQLLFQPGSAINTSARPREKSGAGRLSPNSGPGRRLRQAGGGTSNLT